MIAAGRAAFNSLRMEKGYRLRGTDMTTEHNPYEAGARVRGPAAAEGGLRWTVTRSRAGSEETAAAALGCLTIDDGRSVVLRAPSRSSSTASPGGYVTSAALRPHGRGADRLRLAPGVGRRRHAASRSSTSTAASRPRWRPNRSSTPAWTGSGGEPWVTSVTSARLDGDSG